MFTQIFSILFLKKKKNFLKLKNLDKNAYLPDPSTLGPKGIAQKQNGTNKRDLKS